MQLLLPLATKRAETNGKKINEYFKVRYNLSLEFDCTTAMFKWFKTLY